jgi:hypothetical protein
MNANQESMLFEGKVIRNLCYWHPFAMPIPYFQADTEFAFEAIKFDFGHSAAFVINVDGAIVVAEALDDAKGILRQDCGWYEQEDRNVNKLRGNRITEAIFVRDELARINRIRLIFGQNMAVAIEPSQPSEDESSVWPEDSESVRKGTPSEPVNIALRWPADSRLLKIAFDR